MSEIEAGGFTDGDHNVAYRAWNVYMYEINGTGLRYDFDRTPGNIDDFLERDGMFSPRGHLKEIDLFVDRLRRFGGFLTDLATFKDRPITGPHPMAWDREKFSPTITRNISGKELITYSRLHSAAVDYAGALLQHGPDSSEVREAAVAAAQIVNPEAWEAAGNPGPDDITPYAKLGTRWYLEDVINAPVSQE